MGEFVALRVQLHGVALYTMEVEAYDQRFLELKLKKEFIRPGLHLRPVLIMLGRLSSGL